jgi:uncharacterized repeat protein (TIGR03803 family)
LPILLLFQLVHDQFQWTLVVLSGGNNIMKPIRIFFLAAAALFGFATATHAASGISLTTLFSFGYNYTNTDGIGPSVGLVQSTDGSFYGTTSSGGTNNLGTVFKITTNGIYTRLVSFNGTNGANPSASLVQGSDGNFYGTAYSGGDFDLGTVFKMTPSGVLTTLASFNTTNGANPAANLIQAKNGMLYGTTVNGGANDLDFGGDGTIFQVTTNGALVTIYSFTNANDGGNPIVGLALGKTNNLFGTTPYGGVDGSGSVFKVTTNGVFTTLYSFTGGNDGSTPDAPVILGKDGNFYGTTAYGGKYDTDTGGDGTVFKITATGTLTTLLSFNSTNGFDPEAGLAQGVDGILYGTTTSGGSLGDGTAFKITTNGVFASLISFNGANGAAPYAALAQSTNGNFYGTTTENGPDNLLSGNGIVFKLSTNGALSTLYFFGDPNPNGATPAAGMALGSDGSFYGTTVYGGTNKGSFGTVFKLTTNGTQIVLASFNGTNGAYPQAGLVRGADGNFYGTAAYGGTNNLPSGGDGTVFRVATNGTLTVLAFFNFTNGANPMAGLVQGPDGNFYGTTENGGTNDVASGGDGTIFKVTTNGVLTRLVSFNGTNGANPIAGLVLGPDGNFYGTTQYGGTNNIANGGDGTVFRVTTNGTLTRLCSFNVANGANPAAGLTLATNGLLYGTTQYGGANDVLYGGDGTVFSITTNRILTTLHSFANGSDGAYPTSPLLLGYDGNFYGSSSGGVSSAGVFFEITPDNTFTVLYSFRNGTNGASPVGNLSEGAANYFYGATQTGGINGGGTLFQIYVNPFPFVITQPDSLTSFAGNSASFTVSAIGAAPLSYQWQRNSINLTDNGNITGSATKTLTLTNLALTDAGNYSVIVSNTFGTVTSMVATLTVILPFAPTVTTEAANPVGINSATFNATVNPDGAATTVWFDFGLTTNYANSTAITNIDNGGDPEFVGLNVAGLLPLTTYHYVAVAGNGLGTNVGTDSTFQTPGALTNISFTPLVSFDGANGGAGPQAGLLQGVDGNFYGTTYSGGDYDDGTVFKMASNGTLTVLLSFNGTNGANPQAGLVRGPDGLLYGTTYSGGTNDMDNGGDGTIFKISTNGVFTSLVSFNITNGANPAARLALGPNGNLYGTTENGGTNDFDLGGDGTIFSISTNGTFTSLVSFDNTNNGANPDAELAVAGGLFYGTTSSGGTNGSGTVFSVTTSGNVTTLYSFTGGNDGDDPQAGLALGLDGNLYGTTYDGGDFGSGTVFQITPNGFLTTLYSFTGSSDGGNPQATLTLGSDGNFYGTTSSGGASGYGTVFVVLSDGTMATLVAFDSDVYGANPQAPLILGANGDFYGTTQSGSANGAGTVFQFSVAAFPYIIAQPASLTNFTGNTATFAVEAIGGTPLSYQWQRNSVNLTDAGNVSGSATKTLALANLTLADAGSYSVIVSNKSGVATSTVANLTVILPFPPNITFEEANPVEINSATLNATVNPDGAPTTVWFNYGVTTSYGNSSAVTNIGSGGTPVSASLNLAGLQPFTLYHYATMASNDVATTAYVDATFLTPGARSNITFTPLVAFADTNGSSPQGNLFLSADGNFYGTTYYGGTYEDGTVFRMTPGGMLTTLLSFNGTNGANPQAGLVQGADGLLYGTTYAGGTNDMDTGGDGTVFKITTNGAITSLASFNGADGAAPAGPLLQGADGNFYGTTAAGGGFDFGTVFAITSNGALTTLWSFNNTNGAYPDAGLTLGSDGNFYGTTYQGGTNDVVGGGDGTVFKITTNGIFTSLASFNGTNGANPLVALTLGLDGCLYGTTENGGTNDLGVGGDGTIFKITTNGVLASLYSFAYGYDGAHPQAALTLGSDGNFYGTTFSGPPEGNNGTLFMVTPSGALTTLVIFDSNLYGGNPQAALTLGANGIFYGSATSGGTNANGTLFSFSLISGQPPMFQNVLQTGNTLTLTWSAIIGQTYQLQCTTNLSAPKWINLSSVTATNSTATASDTINSSSQRFYRLVQGQ